MTHAAALALTLASVAVPPASEANAVATGLVGRGVLATPVALGAALFSGTTRFVRGGQPCATCHTISVLGPGADGATLGPDLTAVYDVLGPDQVALALRTHRFAGTFDGRLLTPEERTALEALLREASAARPPAGASGMFAVVALGGFVVMLAAAWMGMR